jgi:hypothetical protein
MNTLIAEIRNELRYPLVPTAYHKKLGVGVSHTFGYVPRRGLEPELSQLSYTRAKLYKLLVDLGETLRVPSYTSITIQHNYVRQRRREKNGSQASLFLLGTYEDTGVQVGERVVETREELVTLDTSQESIVPSAVVEGDRYLILYHRYTLQQYEAPKFEVMNGIVNLSGELSALQNKQKLFWIENKSGRIEFT